MNTEDRRSIRLLVVIIFISFLILFFNISDKLYISAGILAVLLLLMSLIAVLMSNGYAKYARVSLVILINLHLVLCTFAEGLRMGGYMFFLPLLTSISYFIEKNKNYDVQVISCSLLTVLCFCICVFFGYQDGIWQTVPEEIYHSNFYINAVGAVLISAAASYISVHSERKYNEEIIAQKNTAEALNLQLEIERVKSDQANKAKSEFLATMSHEIRTPMNGVIGMVGLLREANHEQERNDFIESIRISSNALMSIINDILDFSKIESGGMELEEHSFNLRQLIEEVIELFSVKADEQGIELLYRIDSGLPENIIADSHRLRQVLSNLVSNALKFTKNGEVLVNVAFSKKDKNINLVFDIIDTGIGIPEDKLSRLFTAFSQVDSSTTRKYGGSGLGLVISERLVALMGGHINVKSKPDLGTTFSFNISAKYKEPIVPATSFLNLNDNGRKILLVVANETNLGILKSYAEGYPVVVLEANDGLQAFNILSCERDIQLLITDLIIPGMKGDLLAKKSIDEFPNLRVILMSSINNTRSFQQSGLFYAVMSKPVKKLVFINYMVSALNGARRPLTTEEKRPAFFSESFSQKYPLDILLVEDNIINQKLALGVLTRLGYNADLAENGREAISMIHNREYHLVLMDILMPEMDGLEATRYIRATPGNQPVIVAMTANALPEDKGICLAAGMDEYISKPIHLEDLIGILKETALSV